MTLQNTHHRFSRACRRSCQPPIHPSSPRCDDGWWLRRHHQSGVVAIEFALLFTFGLVPLLICTFAGVMIFAAKQSLELAAADGARAALQYQQTDTARMARAEAVAGNRMQWLLDFSGSAPAQATSISKASCNSSADIPCITVETFYDYSTHPFLPGTGWMVNGGMLTASATIQLPEGTPQ